MNGDNRQKTAHFERALADFGLSFFFYYSMHPRCIIHRFQLHSKKNAQREILSAVSVREICCLQFMHKLMLLLRCKVQVSLQKFHCASSLQECGAYSANMIPKLSNGCHESNAIVIKCSTGKRKQAPVSRALANGFA